MMFMELINIMDIMEENFKTKKYPLTMKKLIDFVQTRRVMQKYDDILNKHKLDFEAIIDFVRFYNESYITIVDNKTNTPFIESIGSHTKITPDGLYMEVGNLNDGYIINYNKEDKYVNVTHYYNYKGNQTSLSYYATIEDMLNDKEFTDKLNFSIELYVYLYIKTRRMIYNDDIE